MCMGSGGFEPSARRRDIKHLALKLDLGGEVGKLVSRRFSTAHDSEGRNRIECKTVWQSVISPTLTLISRVTNDSSESFICSGT